MLKFPKRLELEVVYETSLDWVHKEECIADMRAPEDVECVVTVELSVAFIVE